MPHDTFDVWLCELRSVPLAEAALSVSRLFGIDAAMAHKLVASVPCVVKRRVQLHDAQSIANALASIGGRVELRPSEPLRGAEPRVAAPGQGETLKLGMLETGGLGYVPTLRPPAVEVSEPPPQELQPQPPPPTAAALRHEPITLDAPAAAEVPALDETRAAAMPDDWRQALILPASIPPAANGAAPRSPRKRERPPRIDKPVAPSGVAGSAARKFVQPLGITAGIWRAARSGTLRDALSGHPVAGFLIVLGVTTLAFMAAIAAL
jgi:hypothetical protein